jgi:hypothetical protein
MSHNNHLLWLTKGDDGITTFSKEYFEDRQESNL